MAKKTTKKTAKAGTPAGPTVSPLAEEHMADLGVVGADGYGEIRIPNVAAENVITTIQTAKAMLGSRFDSADVEPEEGGTFTVIIYTKPAS